MNTYVLAFYESDRVYGGPEEGGWWYNTGDLVRVFKIVKGTENQAWAKARRANDLLGHLQRHKRSTSSMAYSGGRHVVQVYENTAPSHYPTERPYYE